MKHPSHICAGRSFICFEVSPSGSSEPHLVINDSLGIVQNANVVSRRVQSRSIGLEGAPLLASFLMLLIILGEIKWQMYK
jgi:hypothetical protein